MPSWNEWYPVLAGAAIKSVAVLAVASMAAIALRKKSAATRHLVWTAAFAALLALPLLSALLPVMKVPVSPSLLPAGAVFQTFAGTAPVSAARRALLPPTAAESSARPWQPDWQAWMTVAWMMGAGLAFAQMLMGWASMRSVRRKAAVKEEAGIASLAEELGLRDRVELLEAGPGTMPMTFGLLRPAVVLPEEAAEWTPERRRLVLLHELAHVRRGDIAMHVLARFALNLYWWNPLAWIGWRMFLKERERAADDVVLSAGARASDYAGHLLEIARTMQHSIAGAPAVAMARRSQLEGRLMAILDERTNRKRPGRAAAFAAALAAMCIVVPLAALQAQEDPAQLKRKLGINIDQKTPQSPRDYLTARAELELKLNQIANRLGTQSKEYANVLLKLADLVRRHGKPGEAAELYAKALAILGERAETVQAVTYLGIDAFLKKDLDQAVRYFQRAQSLDPVKAGTALMWLALARQNQGNAAEAESFQGALAVSENESSDAATTMELYARFLRDNGREAESGTWNERATTIRKHLSAKAASPATGTTVHRIGGGVSAPQLVYKTEPAYSDEARAAKYQGTVVVGVEIDPNGVAQNIRVIRGMGLGLNDRAVEAISMWKFKPGMRDGQPVTVAATIEVNFRLL